MTEHLADCLFCRRDKWIVRRTENFFVQLDDAPIVEGHALICPRLHYPSMADIPVELLAELEELTSDLRLQLMQAYGTYTMFEHGRTGHCVRRNPSERICHHAHVHALPLPRDIVAALEVGRSIPVSTWLEVAQLASDMTGYLVAETTAGRHLYPATRPLPSHYLRSAAATIAGDVSLADWENLMERGDRQPVVERGFRVLTGADESPIVR